MSSPYMSLSQALSCTISVGWLYSATTNRHSLLTVSILGDLHVTLAPSSALVQE